MNKILGIFLLFFLIASCSLDKATGLWSQNKKIKEEKKIEKKELFKKDEALNKEFNINLKIDISDKFTSNSFVNNLNNNNGRINYNGNLKNISRYKFSKIGYFKKFEPEIILDKDHVIFFNGKGSILKFDNSSKIIWKNNNYSKAEKKSKPILFFDKNNEILVVTDSLAKYYALDFNSGKLLWSKNNNAPFNSQVKIYKNKFFAIDLENILRCYSINDGKELWNIKTQKSFIKSQKRLSLVVVNNKVFFNNSLGDISAVDIETGNLLWQSPTQNTSIDENGFFLKISDLIANDRSILFSTNQNQFFSIDLKSGIFNWVQKINSSLRSTLIDNLIFSVTIEGFLVITDYKSGDIIRITDIFNQFSKKKKSKIKPIGFIVGRNKVYLTTNHGRLLIIDIATGKTISSLKIDNDKISRPYVSNKNLFIVKENAIIRLN